jgi:hypothetical protein
MLIQYVTHGGQQRFVTVKGAAEGHIKKRSARHGGIKVGALIATEVGDKIYVGWSLCHRPIDKFDPKEAISVAKDRITTLKMEPIASSMIKPAERFIVRAQKYYKGKEIIPAFKWSGQPKHIPIKRPSLFYRIWMAFDNLI